MKSKINIKMKKLFIFLLTLLANVFLVISSVQAPPPRHPWLRCNYIQTQNCFNKCRRNKQKYCWCAKTMYVPPYINCRCVASFQRCPTFPKYY